MRLAGFDVTEVIYSVDDTVVARATTASGETVILKYQNTQYPSDELNARWLHEYAILQSLESEWVVKAQGIKKINNSLVLVLEDFAPFNLVQTIRLHKLDLPQCLQLAIQLCEALSDIHKQQLIHNDISPKNILVDLKTLRIKLCDFALATRLLSEQAGSLNKHVHGTLDYMSPEQTGRTNLTVDYRSDFYALGVTLYELFVGCRPFELKDPMALLYAHLARTPEPMCAIDSTIPEQLSNIILRLLAKSPDKRYQSSFGLQADLSRCLNEWKAGGCISVFPVGEFDRPERFNVSHKLYGREQETAVMLAAYERASDGHSELLLVNGSSGIGKTALVDQLHKPVVLKNGLFIKGKCEQFIGNQPYSSLAQAFQPLMQQLLNEGGAKLYYWQFMLRRALGDSAAVLIDIIPELGLIIGEVRPLQPLPGVEAENRFHTVFMNFVNALSSSGCPLVIFLDDLQWADSSTLKLLEQQMLSNEGRALLIIVAYRDNEVNSDHPLTKILKTIEQVQGEVHKLTLSNLKQDQVTQLISDTLRCTINEASPLAALCYDKTKGNPFFLNQFLLSLYDDGDITYDRKKGMWAWDLQLIQQRQITDNVVDFMVSKLRALDAKTQHLVSLASLLGSTFTLRMLAIAYEHSTYECDVIETAELLWPALQQGLIIPLNENYKFSHSPESLNLTQYRFLHDRVQEAAHTLVKHQDMPALRLKTGLLLLRNLSEDELDIQLFTLLELLNHDRHLIKDESKNEQLLALNIRGGIKAKNASAFPAAVSFLETAKALLTSNAWQSKPDQTLLLYRALAESYYMAGNFEAADALYPEGITAASDALSKVSLVLVQATQYQQQGRFSEALPVLLRGLKLLGYDFPLTEDDAAEQLPSLYSTIQKLLNSQSKKEMTQAQYLLEMELHSALTVVLYQLRQFASYGVNSCRMVSLSFKYGVNDLTPLAYLTNAWVMSMMGEPYARCYDIGKQALILSDQRANRYHRVIIYQGFAAFFQHWREPLENTFPLLKKAAEWGEEGLNLTSAGHAVLLGAVNKFIKGLPLNTLTHEANDGLTFLRRTHQSSSENFVKFAILQPSLALQGKTHHDLSFDSDEFSVNNFLGDDYTTPSMELALYSQAMIRHSFIMGDHALQQQFIKNLPVIKACLPDSPSLTESTFYAALILLELLAENTTDDDEKQWLQIKAYAEQFKQWADDCPENYTHKYLMIMAGIAELEGHHPQVMSCYAKAIDEAKRAGFLSCEALANELYARYWLRQNQTQIATHLIQEAHYLYRCWGANVKCNLLENRWPEVTFTLAEKWQESSATQRITAVTHQSDALDLHSLLKANQLLSEELGLEPLLHKMMEVLLENAGAEKGAIILLDEGQMMLEIIGKFDRQTQHISCHKFSKALQNVCEGSTPLLPDALIHHVQETLETVALSCPADDPDFSYSLYFQQQQPKSVMSFPILSQGHLVAVIYLENNFMENAFTSKHKETLKLLSAQLAISLINATLYDKMEMKVAQRTEELRQMSMKDGLTNIANRRAFDERLESEWRRSLRNGQSLSLLMIDIDFFKQYNDFYGHVEGDECIKLVAQALNQSTPRSTDFVARYGGEEFCILMSESDRMMSLKVAKTCLDAIHDLRKLHENSNVESYVTVSIGLCTLLPGIGEEPCKLIAKADEALYRAKRKGRNCIVESD